MDTLLPELLEVIFNDIPIKIARLTNKCIKGLMNIKFINAIHADRNSKWEYFNSGNTCILRQDMSIFIYDNKKLIHHVIHPDFSPRLRDKSYIRILYDETPMSIDLLSVYNILNNKNYVLPANYAKNKILCMLHKSKIGLYVTSRTDIVDYFLWMVANAMMMGILPFEYTININLTDLKKMKEHNKVLYKQIEEYILSL